MFRKPEQLLSHLLITLYFTFSHTYLLFFNTLGSSRIRCNDFTFSLTNLLQHSQRILLPAFSLSPIDAVLRYTLFFERKFFHTHAF